VGTKWDGDNAENSHGDGDGTTFVQTVEDGDKYSSTCSSLECSEH